MKASMREKDKNRLYESNPYYQKNKDIFFGTQEEKDAHLVPKSNK
jgi:hypothetical protein